MKERFWKVTGPNGEACHGGSFTYDLPKWSKTKGWVPGAWTPLIANVEPCHSGYHVCRDKDLLGWYNNARIWACEIRGERKDQSDKVAAGQVRLLAPTPWDDVTARLFAVDVAAAALPLFEKYRPTDSRVSDCLEVAHRYALGDANDSDRAAAWDAARAAARAAAGDAARAAAWAAAWAAAGAVAGAAARDVAWDAARQRQTAVLLWWLGASLDYPE